MIRLIYHIPILIFFAVFRIILILLGWVMVPLALITDSTRIHLSYIHANRLILDFKGIFWLWGNSEDGIIAAEEFKEFPSWFRILYWCAFRNPVNNLRFVPYLSCKIVPAQVKWIGTIKHPVHFDKKPPVSEWFYSWQGAYSNIWIQWRMLGRVWRFWLGWKIFPADSLGDLPETSYRRTGAGFAMQFKALK